MGQTVMAAMKAECQRQGHAVHMVCCETFADADIARTRTAAVLVQVHTAFLAQIRFVRTCYCHTSKCTTYATSSLAVVFEY